MNCSLEKTINGLILSRIFRACRVRIRSSCRLYQFFWQSKRCEFGHRARGGVEPDHKAGLGARQGDAAVNVREEGRQLQQRPDVPDVPTDAEPLTVSSPVANGRRRISFRPANSKSADPDSRRVDVYEVGKGGEGGKGGGNRGGEGGAPNRPTNHPADSPPPTYLLPSPPRPRPPPPPTIPPHPPDGHDAHAYAYPSRDHDQNHDRHKR